ncbi:molecular chaperone TorD [Vibrio pectenicida]|uniref:Chaperone protein TorD n=1 Tax=Vibrio pectenicida TaxID=62763 RepID=A0A7Y3ZXZ7_9VIBR|nr:molecular chaperone TorD [Vibrio pectenicida]NOH71110.1 molecular chaperone TorD [Vibrio pectenicida]
MQEIKTFNEQRAEVYWWLSSLLAQELSQEKLEQYHSTQIRSFLAGLGETPHLQPRIQRFVDALNRLLDRNDAQLELAADFCNLFLKSDKDSALPYASIYIGQSGLLNDKPAKDMENLMVKHGITVSKNINEPADHIAIELDFLGHLIICSNQLGKQQDMEASLLEQGQFIQQHLLTWVPLFNNKCQILDTFGFYASISALLLAFIELDHSYLIGD